MTNPYRISVDVIEDDVFSTQTDVYTVEDIVRLSDVGDVDIATYGQVTGSILVYNEEAAKWQSTTSIDQLQIGDLTIDGNTITIDNAPLVLNASGLDLSGTNIHNVADPVEDEDATNKGYVDALVTSAVETLLETTLPEALSDVAYSGSYNDLVDIPKETYQSLDTNLNSYPYTLAYNEDGTLHTKTWVYPEGNVVKTFTWQGGVLQSASLSGVGLPEGVSLVTKTYTFSQGRLVAVVYS